MPRHVDFDEDLDAAVGAIFLYFAQVLATPDLGLVVGAFEGEVRERGDFERPGLGVRSMDMEPIEFVEAHAFECSEYIFRGNPVAGDVEVDATVFEEWPVPDENWRIRCIYISTQFRVGIKELGEGG